MNRRQVLLGGLSGLGGVTLLTQKALAAIQCTPFNPYNGVQQCQAGIPSFYAQAKAQQQMASQWCWAASISMICGYGGRQINQVRIVQEVWGGIVNMPAQPFQIMAAVNRPWRDDNGGPFMIQGDVMSANVYTAIDDLSQNFPLIICTSHHAMVLTALTYMHDARNAVNVTAATVRDPWPGSPSQRVLSPQEWYDVRLVVRVRVS